MTISATSTDLPETPARPYGSGGMLVLGLLAPALAAWGSSDLLVTWRASPLDRAGPHMFVLWLITLAAARGWRQRPCPVTLTASMALLLAGQCMTLNVLEHTSLALSLCAWVPGRRWRVCALAAASGWMPAYTWLLQGLPDFGLVLGQIAPPLAFASLIWLRRAAPQPFRHTATLAPRLLAASSVVLAVLGLWLWEPGTVTAATSRLPSLTLNGPDYYSQDIAIAPQEREVFGNASWVKRECFFRSQRAVLLALDGSQNRHAVHDPTFCLRSAGWTVIDSSTLPMPGGEASHLTLERHGQLAQVAYWWTDGQHRHASAMHYWWQTALRRLSRGHSGPEPVLVMLQPATAAPIDWHQWTTEFPPLIAL